MACSLAALTSSRSLRPVATISGRFFNVKHKGRRTPEIRDIFKKAICPHLSSARNLARLLNLMDNRIGVTPATCPRWDVIEDTKVLYVIRDMSGLPNKDFVVQSISRSRWRTPTTMSFWLGRDGFGPGILYPGYFVRIYIPETIYRSGSDILMDVKDEVLKINIPKKKGKWTPNITIRAGFTGLHLLKGSTIKL